MKEAEILEVVNKIFREVFDDDSIIVTEQTTAQDIADWDSFEHINLIVSIEKAFKIKFSMEEAGGMKNVGEMIDIIKKRA